MNTRTPLAAGAAVGALVIVGLAWAVTFTFHATLGVSDTSQTIWRIIEFVGCGGWTGAVLYPAARGLQANRRATRLVAEGKLHDARVEAEHVVKWSWYVVGFGLTVFIITGMVFLISTKDATVRRTFLRWEFIHSAIPTIRKGFWLNIKLFVLAEIFVLIWALIIAVLRMLPGKATRPVRFLVVAYTDIFRGMPAIVALYLIVFGIQLSQFPLLKELTSTQRCVFALVLVYGAYVAEVYRAGIESVHWSQTAAARSLGLSSPQTMRFVILPQAVRRVVPPLLNDFIGLQKDTALVSVIGLNDAFNNAKFRVSKNFNLSPIIGVAFCFIIITIPMARFTDYLIKRDQQRTRAGG